MNYVVKVSNQPITGTDPNSVMAAIQSTMVYADPRNDITNDVIYNLNRVYKATAGPAPKAPAIRRQRRGGQPGPRPTATELAEVEADRSADADRPSRDATGRWPG